MNLSRIFNIQRLNLCQSCMQTFVFDCMYRSKMMLQRINKETIIVLHTNNKLVIDVVNQIVAFHDKLSIAISSRNIVVCTQRLFNVLYLNNVSNKHVSMSWTSDNCMQYLECHDHIQRCLLEDFEEDDLKLLNVTRRARY